jgi:hypothetical protein
VNGKPVVVYVSAEYCPYCAFQRWPLILALMRFGNFTGLHYMTSALSDGDYSTFTFWGSSYQSNYVVFQPSELFNRSGAQLQTLPANYSASWGSQGKSSFPFLNFGDVYFELGATASPAMLDNLNQSQIIAAIQSANTLGSSIRQAANVITALICKVTDDKPLTVCGNNSITTLLILPVSYLVPQRGQESDQHSFFSDRFST